MTRDGTFRIRDGKIAEPLVNLRFTIAVPDFLGDVLGLTRTAALVNSQNFYGERYPYGVQAPAIASARFAVTASARRPGSDGRVVDVSERVLAPAVEAGRHEPRVDDPGDGNDDGGVAKRDVETFERGGLASSLRAPAAGAHAGRLPPRARVARESPQPVGTPRPRAWNEPSKGGVVTSCGPRPTSRHCPYKIPAP